MSYAYAERKKALPAEQPRQRGAQLPAAPLPSAAEASLRPVDLPGAIQAKMEASFGADLSAVKLYESQAVAEGGAQAVAQGNRIAFAPGMLDFASTKGQALLGHELSHVVSQTKGEVTGSGFLNDAALEARADREGAMAAAGEQIYAGPVSAPLSAASPASTAGPMQAKKESDEEKKARLADEKAERIIALQGGGMIPGFLSDEEEQELETLQSNKLDDGVLRALAQKQVEGQIATTDTYYLNKGRGFTSAPESDAENLIRSSHSPLGMRPSVIPMFLSMYYRSADEWGEDPDELRMQNQLMQEEHLKNLNAQENPFDDPEWATKAYNQGAEINQKVQEMPKDEWYEGIDALANRNYQVALRHTLDQPAKKKGFFAKLFGR